MDFQKLELSALHIDDEASFGHVALYQDLKAVLERSHYRFRVPPRGTSLSWDRAVFLNLSFWNGRDGDVLVDDHIAADVVAHVAWHHLSFHYLEGAQGRSPAAMLFGEAIASAFDLYLVGRLVGHARESSFLESQVPAMRDVAEANGMTFEQFEGLLEEISDQPERAFEDLRQLLFDASLTLAHSRSIDEAAHALSHLESRRFGALIHHYELSNWILFVRAHGGEDLALALKNELPEQVAQADKALRSSNNSVGWLDTHWVQPLLSGA